MTAAELLQQDIDRFSITPPTEDEMRAFFLKVFEFLKEVIPSDKFDKFVDKQISKLEDDKIDAFDVLFTFVKALFAKA